MRTSNYFQGHCGRNPGSSSGGGGGDTARSLRLLFSCVLVLLIHLGEWRYCR